MIRGSRSPVSGRGRITSAEKLSAHEVDRKALNHYKINLPKLGKNFVEFTNYKNKEKVPFTVYAYCEYLLKPAEKSQENNPNTEVFQHHKIFSIGYYSKCSYDDSLCGYHSSPEGAGPVKWFTKELEQLAEGVETVFNHCHLTGRYRGPAHQNCNIHYQVSRIIPVVFRNLTEYDAHFIIHEICTEFEWKDDFIRLNNEIYISFTKHVRGSEIKFRFIDLFRFMASSLE